MSPKFHSHAKENNTTSLYSSLQLFVPATHDIFLVPWIVAQ